MRSESTTNDFQTDGIKGQTLAFTSNQPDALIKQAKFKIDEHGFTLSIQFRDEDVVNEFSSHKACSFSEFDDLSHTFKFNFDNLKTNELNELLEQLFQVDKNFNDTKNEIKKLINHHVSIISMSSHSITNNFVQGFKILFAIYQINQRSIMSSIGDLAPYNNDRRLVLYERKLCYEATDSLMLPLMRSFLFSSLKKLLHTPSALYHKEIAELGLSPSEVITPNFGWHTINAIITIKKRTPELSSTEVFKMVEGKSSETTKQFVTSYLIATKKTRTSINEMTLIRVLVNTGRGFGHQRAAITLMQKLREMGFKGTFDIQCNDRIGATLFSTETKKMYQNAETLVSSQLIAMIPGFVSSEPNSDGVRIIGELGAIKISSLPDGYAESRDLGLTKADLAVCAADDNVLGNEDVKPNILNTEVYIGLQPTDWHMGSCFVAHHDGIAVDLPEASTMRLSSMAAYRLPDISLISLSTTEQRIIDITKNGNVNSQLVYGLYPALHYSLESMSMSGTGNLDEHIEMQRIIDANFLVSQNTRKPSILLLPQKIALDEYFIEKIKNNNTHTHIYFLDLTKNDVNLGIYEADDIIVAYTGHLQQTVFDHLMLHGTTLPPVIEGCNSREVCESAGRPFIHGSGKYRPIRQYEVELENKQLLHTQASFCLEQGDPMYVPQLAQYMEESLTSNPELMAYHAQRREAFFKRPDACEIAFDTLGIPYQKMAQTNTFEARCEKSKQVISETSEVNYQTKMPACATLGILFFNYAGSAAAKSSTTSSANSNEWLPTGPALD